MTIDLRTASVYEMRDWLAVNVCKRSLVKQHPPDCYEAERVVWMHENETYLLDHPIPATLDAIAAVWGTELKGWGWDRYSCWKAWKGSPSTTKVEIRDTGDELADRLRLTCLALAAERNIQ